MGYARAYPHGAVIWGRHVPDDDSRLILTGQARIQFPDGGAFYRV